MKYNKQAAVPELDSALLSACSCFINCENTAAPHRCRAGSGSLGKLICVCVCEERHGRVVWTDPGMH